MTRSSLRFAATAMLALSLAGCGGGDDDATIVPSDDAAYEADVADADGDSERDAGRPEVAGGHGGAGDASDAILLQAGDIDAIVAGVRAELAELKDIAADIASSKTDAGKLMELSRLQPGELAETGGDAAGLDPKVYAAKKDRLFAVLSAAQMTTAMSGQFTDIDTSAMDPETAAQTRANAEAMLASMPDPYADVDAETADAIRARVDELLALHAEYVGQLFNTMR